MGLLLLKYVMMCVWWRRRVRACVCVYVYVCDMQQQLLQLYTLYYCIVY